MTVLLWQSCCLRMRWVPSSFQIPHLAAAPLSVRQAQDAAQYVSVLMKVLENISSHAQAVCFSVSTLNSILTGTPPHLTLAWPAPPLDSPPLRTSQPS